MIVFFGMGAQGAPFCGSPGASSPLCAVGLILHLEKKSTLHFVLYKIFIPVPVRALHTYDIRKRKGAVTKQ